MSVILNAFVGLLAGVLINYLADVLPASRRFARPQCRACGQVYPLKDYLLAPKCPHCGKKAPARTYLVLLGSAAVSVLLHFFPFFNLSFWATLPLLVYFGVVAVIDLEHRLVLLEISLVGLALGLIYGWLMRGLPTTLWGGLGGLLVMLAFYLLGIVFAKVVGKIRHKNISETAFGFGDVFVGTILGLLMGWPAVVGAFIIGFLAFALFSLGAIILLAVTKRYRAFANAQALAPFLILGAIVVFYL